MKIDKFHHKPALFIAITLACMVLLAAYPIAADTLRSDNPAAKDQKSLEVPPGTVLPVKLNSGFSSKNAKVGQVLTARIMQDVPLPNNGKIPAGSKVLGTIVSVEPGRNGGNGKLALRFDTLEIQHRKIPIVTNLRAVAGFMDVLEAQTPEATPGFGTPYRWATTRQIGGDEVYGLGGPVTDESNNTVGKAVYGGVLVHIRAKPGTKCHGDQDAEDRLQALWVFSSDACGVYGVDGVTIAHAGRTEPTGEMVLAADHRDVLVRGGSAMLLRVIR